MGRLAQKLRAAREITVEAGGFKFLAFRPTDLEMIDLRGNGDAGRLIRFLRGWEGVKESDIVANGDPHPAAFDAEDAREWLADRPDLFSAITTGLLQAYKAHADELEARLKNSLPGSSSETSNSASSQASSV